MRIGYQLLVELLAELGLDMVFGVPGSESVEVFDELRRKKIRTVLATSEREAAFMAVGHYSASGRVAGLCTIGGPGFTNALTGVAEAREDSAAMLYLLICRDSSQGSFGLHAIDHRSVATPLAKAFHTVRAASGLEQTVRAAYAEAIGGEPGPVVVELTRQAIIGYTERLVPTNVLPDSPRVETGKLEDRLRESKRPAFFVGQGVVDASKPFTDLAETLQCPVLSTGSGRGALPDRHPLCIGTSFGQERPSEVVETIMRDSDLVLALGCKFSHNGSYGHRLPLKMEKLARVDASREVVEANYPASISLVADVPTVVEQLRRVMQGTAPKEWGADKLRSLRARADDEHDLLGARDSNLRTPGGQSPATVFAMLREALPDDARVVTDSGLHQFLARTHFEVRQPRTLLFPTDFQSMGYGLPAAAGAQLATPDRTTVAVVGDGGFAMTALELATAKREHIPIKVLVFNNGTLELIRESQIKKRGAEHAIRLLIPDLEIFAASLDLPFARWDDLSTDSLRDLLEMTTPVLIEVRMTGTRTPLRSKITGHARAIIEPRLDPGIAESIWQRRHRPRD